MKNSWPYLFLVFRRIGITLHPHITNRLLDAAELGNLLVDNLGPAANFVDRGLEFLEVGAFSADQCVREKNRPRLKTIPPHRLDLRGVNDFCVPRGIERLARLQDLVLRAFKDRAHVVELRHRVQPLSLCFFNFSA
jgi:hypothetical protein